MNNMYLIVYHMFHPLLNPCLRLHYSMFHIWTHIIPLSSILELEGCSETRRMSGSGRARGLTNGRRQRILDICYCGSVIILHMFHIRYNIIPQ